jgi:hypothetical protein
MLLVVAMGSFGQSYSVRREVVMTDENGFNHERPTHKKI